MIGSFGEAQAPLMMFNRPIMPWPTATDGPHPMVVSRQFARHWHPGDSRGHFRRSFAGIAGLGASDADYENPAKLLDLGMITAANNLPSKSGKPGSKSYKSYLMRHHAQAHGWKVPNSKQLPGFGVGRGRYLVDLIKQARQDPTSATPDENTFYLTLLRIQRTGEVGTRARAAVKPGYLNYIGKQTTAIYDNVINSTDPANAPPDPLLDPSTITGAQGQQQQQDTIAPSYTMYYIGGALGILALGGGLLILLSRRG